MINAERRALMKNVNEVIERVKTYEPLWDGWTYTGNLIGSGGSGCVLELANGELRSVVKVIHVDDNLEKYNAVKNEIETMITLRSAYLVECLNYRVEQVFNRKGEAVGYDFLIHMNKYEPFTEFLREEDFDPNALCVQLALEIGISLCVLHSHGILHRDVKPENIFIDEATGKLHFRLGDFGVSKRISDMSGLTTTGTLSFMAPESYQYNEYGYSSDIYNFGMTLYYILNDLRFPQFVEENSQGDIDINTDCRLRGDRLPKPEFGSEHLQSVVLKACEAKPKDRYKDVSEMLGELFGQTIERAGVERKKNPLDNKTYYRKQISIKRNENVFRELVKIFFNKKALISVAALLLASVITVFPAEWEYLQIQHTIETQIIEAMNNSDSEKLYELLNNNYPEKTKLGAMQHYCTELVDNYNSETANYGDTISKINAARALSGNRFSELWDTVSSDWYALQRSKQQFTIAQRYLKNKNITEAVEAYANVISKDTNYQQAQALIAENIDAYVDEQINAIQTDMTEWDDSESEGINEVELLINHKYDYLENIFEYYLDHRENYNKLTQYKAIDDFRESLYKYIYAFFHSVSEGALNDYFDTAIMLYTINDYTNVNKDYNGRFDDLLSKLTKREIENIEENISKIKTAHNLSDINLSYDYVLRKLTAAKGIYDESVYQRLKAESIDACLNISYLDLDSCFAPGGGLIYPRTAHWLVNSGVLEGTDGNRYQAEQHHIYGFAFQTDKPVSGSSTTQTYFSIDSLTDFNVFFQRFKGKIVFMKGDDFAGSIIFKAYESGEQVTIKRINFESTLDDIDLDFDCNLTGCSGLTIELQVDNIPQNTKTDVFNPYRSPYKFYIVNGQIEVNVIAHDL